MYTDPFCREHRYGPPAGWVLPEGQQTLGEADWIALVNRGLNFFEPYDGPRELGTTFGVCLAPLLVGGNHYIETRPIEPDEVLVENDFYTIEEEDQEGLRRAIRERLGRSMDPARKMEIAKFLRYMCFEWYKLSADGVSTLSNGDVVTHKIVGIVPLTGPTAGISSTPTTRGPKIYWDPRNTIRAASVAGAMLLSGCAASPEEAQAPQCNRQPFAADAQECALINANAVSQIADAYTGLLTSIIGQVGTTNPGVMDILSITLNLTGQPIAIDVYAPVTGGNTAGATCSAASLTVQRDGSAITASNFNLAPLINSGSIVWTPITLSLSDTPAAGSHTYTVHVSVTASGTGGSASQANFGQTYLKVREIKR